jgi:nitroreductase
MLPLHSKLCIMTVLETILTRRSIRKYIKKDIPAELVDKILEAAMYAPTARNTQSWEFVVIKDRGLLDQLAVLHPYAKMLKYAPMAVLVCGNQSIEDNEAYLNQNCSAATQSLMLAAHALGLGSVWLGVYPKAERIDPIRELLKIPAYVLPVSLVSVGWPDEVRETPDRFDRGKIHFNDIW